MRAVHMPKTRSVVFALCVLTACGTGGGTSTQLPRGEPTTAAPGDKVVYATLAQGDQVAAFRLGQDGLLPAAPFSTFDIENPRRVVLGDGVLYVAGDDRVVALSLGADGSLPAQPTSQVTPNRNIDPVALLLLDGVLYVAFENQFRVQAFILESGQLPPDPSSSSGTAQSDYRSLAVFDGFLYAGAEQSARIDTYRIQPDGTLPAMPEPQLPDTTIFLPEDIVIRDGTLYAIAQARESIQAYEIRANGLLPAEPDSRTGRNARYARLLLDGDRIYATAFTRGGIHVFQLDPVDGSLTLGPPFFRTAADAASFPIAMRLDNGIIYVAQAGLGRIDAYIVNGDGSLSLFPSSSTDVIPDSFPTDIVIGEFSP